ALISRRETGPDGPCRCPVGGPTVRRVLCDPAARVRGGRQGIATTGERARCKPEPSPVAREGRVRAPAFHSEPDARCPDWRDRRESAAMRPLHVSADEFRTLADGVTGLAAEFLASLDDRQTLSATSAADTAAFDGPLPERGGGDAVLRDLSAIAEHVRAP